MTTLLDLDKLPREAAVWASVSGGKDSTAMLLGAAC